MFGIRGVCISSIHLPARIRTPSRSCTRAAKQRTAGSLGAILIGRRSSPVLCPSVYTHKVVSPLYSMWGWAPPWVSMWDSSQHALWNEVLFICLFIQHSFWNNVIMLSLSCWVWVRVAVIILSVFHWCLMPSSSPTSVSVSVTVTVFVMSKYKTCLLSPVLHVLFGIS